MIFAILLSWVVIAGGVWYVANSGMLSDDEENEEVISSLGAGSYTITLGDSITHALPSWMSSYWSNPYVDANPVASPFVAGQILTLNKANNTLSFSPVATGSFTVWIELFDTQYEESLGSDSFTVSVIPGGPDLDFTSPPPVSITSGQVLVYTPTTNIPGATITIADDAPSWAMFDGIQLMIIGPSASVPTSYTIVLTATYGSQTATQTISLNVLPMLEITSSPPTGNFIAGNLYSYQATSNMPVASWSITGPSWLSINPVTGAVTGTVPSSITSPQVITYTIDVFRDSPFQVAYQLVSINVVPVLGFTSAPTADMIITPIDGLTFKFTPTGNNVQSLLWDFGDGNTSSEWAPVHTYAEPGEYAVKQTAFNPLGFDTAIQTLSVGDIIEKIDDFWQPWYIYVIGLILGFLILLCIASRMKRRA